MLSTVTSAIHGLSPRLFGHDRRGVSAVEFAFIAPILLTFYFASVEVSTMLTVDRKVTNVASAIGDLVAQDDLVDANEVDDVFDAARAIVDPYDSTAMKMRVSSIRMEPDNSLTVRWSRAQGFSPLACGAAVTVPAGILSPGQSVVMAEVELPYSTAGDFLTEVFHLDDVFYLRPRRSVEVEFDPPPC